MSKQLAQQCYDNDLRAEQVVHLATMCTTDVWGYVRELFEEQDDVIWQVLGIDAPEHKDAESMGRHLFVNGRHNFLVQMSTPIPEEFLIEGSNHSYWGIFATQWFYADDMEAVFQQALAWKKEVIDANREQVEGDSDAKV